MKNITLSLILVFAVCFANAGNDPEKKISKGKYFNVSLAPKGSDKDINDGGFFLNIGLWVPAKNCYFPMGVTNNTVEKFGIGPSLEVGNLFPFTKLGNHAIGLKATWLSASISPYTDENIDATVAQGSVLRFGPYFTFGMSDEMAMDVYLQIGASYAYDIDSDTVASGNDDAGYLGATSNAGIAFRYKMFAFGMDLSMGKLKYVDKDEYEGLSKDIIDDFYRIRSTAFRIYAGFKF